MSESKKARQIQIRRGTTADHENFTGALAEITMDTDIKTLRVHDGQTPGGILLARADDLGSDDDKPVGDVVVESASGLTDTNYIDGWYRKYASGWVEQGGKSPALSGGLKTIVLPVPMADANYSVGLSPAETNVLSQWSFAARPQDYKDTSFILHNGNAGDGYFWEVRGQAA